MLSGSLWCSGADPSWAAKRFRGRFHQGSAKAPPRFHQGLTKPRLRRFHDLSGLLGQIRFGVPKGSVEGSPITSLNLSPSSSTLFCISPQGSSAIVQVLGKMTGLSSGILCNKWLSPPKRFFGVFPKQFSLHWSHSLLQFFGQMAVASELVLWRVPPTILCICLPNGCCFIKVLWRVPPTVLYSLLLGSKLRELLTWSAENDPSCRCCWGILWFRGRIAFGLSLVLWGRSVLGR